MLLAFGSSLRKWLLNSYFSIENNQASDQMGALY